MGAMDWLLNQIGNATWGRWLPGAPQKLEGGVDVPEPAGTPIYALGTGTLTGAGYFYHGGPYFSQQETGGATGKYAGDAPGYGVVTEDVPGTGQVYYQHIDLAPGIPFCQSGACNGYQVQAGQLLGYSRANPGEVEVGINPTWGGIWGTNQNQYLWQSDPRNSLIGLAQQNSSAPAQNSSTPPCPWQGVPILGDFYCLGYNGYNDVTGIASGITKDPAVVLSVLVNGVLGKLFLFAAGAVLLIVGFHMLTSTANQVIDVAVNGASKATGENGGEASGGESGGESSGGEASGGEGAPAALAAPSGAAPTVHHAGIRGKKQSGIAHRAANVEKIAKVAALA